MVTERTRSMTDRSVGSTTADRPHILSKGTPPVPSPPPGIGVAPTSHSGTRGKSCAPSGRASPPPSSKSPARGRLLRPLPPSTATALRNGWARSRSGLVTRRHGCSAAPPAGRGPRSNVAPYCAASEGFPTPLGLKLRSPLRANAYLPGRPPISIPTDDTSYPPPGGRPLGPGRASGWRRRTSTIASTMTASCSTATRTAPAA